MVNSLLTNQDECEIACKLPREDLKQRKAAIASTTKKASNITEDEDGLELLFIYSRKMLYELTEFISVERECCPFINFYLQLSNNSNNIVLTIAGKQGTKQFIKYELEIGNANVTVCCIVNSHFMVHLDYLLTSFGVL